MGSPFRDARSSQLSIQSTRGDTRAAAIRVRVSETFVSRQGEGELTGTDSFFVRTSGCNLRCWFCDTPYASWHPEGDQVCLESLLEQADESGCRHIVLTGGEPLVYEATETFCQLARQAGYHLTIETAGTVPRQIECDLLSLSPKLSGSAPDPEEHPEWHQRHQQRRLPINVMRDLIDRSDRTQVKFVVDHQREWDEVLLVVDDLQVSPDQVWIMPQAVTVQELDQSEAWLRPWAEGNRFRYCDRQQIRWYGNRRGT
ncbi:MAG: 7-carboxy-7-deazaguanine synthase QueE [Planctomycetota bacterium]